MDEVTRIQELRRALTQSDSGSFLVESRVIRRVIREMNGYARLTTAIPHADLQVVAAVDVRALCHSDELGLDDFTGLPELCLLIALPEEGELQHWPVQELMQLIWRRLFHGMIDRKLFEMTRSRKIDRAKVQDRIAQIGQVEFDEAHFVLKSESRLIDTESRVASYCEFAAVYLELQRFAPDLLPVWFPSLAGSDHIDQILKHDVDADSLYEASRLYSAPPPDLTPRVARDEQRLISTRQHWSLGIGITPSDRAYLRQLRRRNRANERGNTVGAVIAAIRAAERATSDDKREAANQRARADVANLSERLQRALSFADDELSEWQASLWELATNSIHGFWNADKRLLYDLQKVCMDHERVIYRVDVLKWIFSRGKRPLRRPLNSIREVMMAKHLASSAGRLVNVRLSGLERERLDGLLHEATHLAEQQMRQRMRPAIKQTMLNVGLVPKSVPEQVAMDKLVEDSLDCIAERGYLTMGYLRDAISRNDLKLPDLTDPMELIRGDHLLRSDDRLDIALDGVYRRGEIYLRWLQISSALFFGTRAGRFITLYLTLPFGGAVVVVEIFRHLLHVITGTKHSAGVTATNQSGTLPADPAAGVSRTTSPLSEKQAVPDGGFQQATSTVEVSAATTAKGAETVQAAAQQTDTAGNVQTASPPGATSVKISAADLPAAVPASESGQTALVVKETTSVPVEDPVDQIIAQQVQTLSVVLVIGFLLMGLIHAPRFRAIVIRVIRQVWKGIRAVVIDTPIRILRLPVVQLFWRNRTIVRLRQWIISPFLFAAFLGKGVFPMLLSGEMTWAWVATLTLLLSLALNSRLGKDAEELTAEWIANLWYDMRTKIVRAVYDWIIDVFKAVLGVVERFLYAVDEWLRFHSEESWPTIVAKGLLGMVWSFISFLIRIYVNLLIEPTLHPVKHFPVVTVAHKMFLPAITTVGIYMLNLFTPYLGKWLAGVVTGFNIFFLPGIFGFLVWEMKENWRLYAANRHTRLRPAAVGSHGETLARLMKPGFHSGTLPKLFRRMRHLERIETSFRRFSLRRTSRSQLEHVERDVLRFVQRDLIHLLEHCVAWHGAGLRCDHVHAASNSIQVHLACDRLSDQTLLMLFQEQSGWVVATISETGWLRYASAEQVRSLENALEGFYRRAGVELVREQLEQRLIGHHSYDINTRGLDIWPNGQFNRELHVDLNRRHTLRPMPAAEAALYELYPCDKELVVFSESFTEWAEWEKLWEPAKSSSGIPLPPPACSRAPRHQLLRVPR
jgi:hypothetical protein